MDPSAMLGFDALAVDGPNPVGIPQPRKKGRPAKEGKEKGEKAPKADRRAHRNDEEEGAEREKALGIDLQERPRDEAQVDVDEKKQVLRQIAQYRRSFGGELTSTKKLSLATPLDELKEEYEEIQRELSTRGSLEAARLFLIAGMHSLEHLNKAYDPIGLKLDGLGQATLSSMDQVQPILEELVIKYSRYVTLGPEARLGMALVQTVLAVHAANANPEMMKEVTEAAASTAAEPRAVGGKFNGL
eukprot:tig00021603_g22830.t1